MVRTRRESRRKQKSPLQTSQELYGSAQDYPYSPPISVQSTASPSMRMSPLRNILKISFNSTLKSARRVINEPIPSNEDVKPPEPPNFVVQSHVVRDAPKLAALDQDTHVNPPSSRENYVASHVVDAMPEKRTTSRCLSTSVNLTEFVKRQNDDEDDDEVESALDPSLDCVNGHKVKREHAPLLRAIFEKYGDITNECEGQPHTIVSLFLERVCAIYERLKATKFSKVTVKDLTEMLDEVRFLEREKFNLGWLRQKLEHINNAKVSSQNYLTVKQDCEKCDIMIRSLEEKLAEMKEKADRCKKMARDIRTRVDELRTRSLVHGLL